MSWKEKTPRKLSFGTDIKEGDAIVGTIESCQKAGALDVNTYTIATQAEGDKPSELIGFLGNTMLDKVLPNEIGNLVRIKYLGKVRTAAKREVMQFRVDVWEDDDSADEMGAADGPSEEEMAQNMKPTSSKKK